MGERKNKGGGHARRYEYGIFSRTLGPLCERLQGHSDPLVSGDQAFSNDKSVASLHSQILQAFESHLGASSDSLFNEGESKSPRDVLLANNGSESSEDPAKAIRDVLKISVPSYSSENSGQDGVYCAVGGQGTVERFSEEIDGAKGWEKGPVWVRPDAAVLYDTKEGGAVERMMIECVKFKHEMGWRRFELNTPSKQGAVSTLVVRLIDALRDSGHLIRPRIAVLSGTRGRPLCELALRMGSPVAVDLEGCGAVKIEDLAGMYGKPNGNPNPSSDNSSDPSSDSNPSRDSNVESGSKDGNPSGNSGSESKVPDERIAVLEKGGKSYTIDVRDLMMKVKGLGFSHVVVDGTAGDGTAPGSFDGFTRIGCGSTQGKNGEELFLRCIERDKDKAFIHWWYYPDSYDEWVAGSEVQGRPEPPRVREPGSVCFVGSRWLVDSARFNEFMNIADYELDDGTFPSRSPSPAAGENAATAGTKRKAGENGEDGGDNVIGEDGRVTKRARFVMSSSSSAANGDSSNDNNNNNTSSSSSAAPSSNASNNSSNNSKMITRKQLVQRGEVAWGAEALAFSNVSRMIHPLTAAAEAEIHRRIALESDPSIESGPLAQSGTLPRSANGSGSGSSSGEAGNATPGSKRSAASRSMGRGVHQHHPHIVSEYETTSEILLPSYSTWFTLDVVHEIERRSLPEFFAGIPSKTETTYIEMRNFMVNAYRMKPDVYLTITACRRNLAGDVCTVMRVHAFLEHWGIINTHVEPDTVPVPIAPPTSHDKTVTVVAPKVIPQGGTAGSSAMGPGSIPAVNVSLRRLADPLAIAGREVASMGNKSMSGIAASRVSLANRAAVIGNKPIPDITEGLFSSTSSDPKSGGKPIICGECGVECSARSGPLYRCIAKGTYENLILCGMCFSQGKFSSDLSSNHFRVVDTTAGAFEIEHAAEPAWTEQETLILLEAIGRHGTDWDKVSAEVATKSAAECVKQFVTLPLEDPTAEDDPNTIAAIRESADPLNAAISAADVDRAVNMNVPFVAAPGAPANPVMSQVAFLASVVDPSVAAAASRAALKVILDDEKQRNSNCNSGNNNNNKNNNNNSDDESLRKLYSTACHSALAAAAVKAKMLSHEEEREIQRLSNAAVEAQMRKVELKLTFLENIERKQLDREREILDNDRRQLMEERLLVRKLQVEMEGRQQQPQQQQQQQQQQPPAPSATRVAASEAGQRPSAANLAKI